MTKDERQIELCAAIDVNVWDELTCLADVSEGLSDGQLDAIQWIVRSAYTKGRADVARGVRLNLAHEL